MIFDPTPLAFWVLATMVTACALAAVRARKLYHAGLGLVGSLFGVAGLYVLLHTSLSGVFNNVADRLANVG